MNEMYKTLKNQLAPPVTLAVLVNNLLMSTTEAYKEHWKTTTHARHKATQDYFDGMPSHIDTLVESYQGLYGIQNLKAEVSCPPTFEAFLEQCKKLSIEFGASCEHSFISNICDEITAFISRTLYKINNLK